MLEKILQKNEEVINYLYYLSKTLVILISSFLAFKIHIDTNKFQEYLQVSVLIIFLNIILELIFYRKNRFYNKSFLSLIKKDYYQLFIAILILIFIAALLKVTSSYSRIWLLLFILISLFFLFLNKYLFNKAYDVIITSNILTKNLLLIGNFEDCKSLIRNFRKDNRYHIRACIFIDKNSEEKYFPIQSINLDNKLSFNISYLKISQIWIIAAENLNKNNIMSRLNVIPIDIRTIYNADNYQDYYIENINGYSIYDTSLSPFYGFNYLIKLLIDFFFGLIFILVSVPIIFFFSLLIFIEDGKPIFFTQKRHGWDGSIIKIYKLRSLKKSTDQSQVLKDDKRMLRIGKFIRKFSIDELPQFFNVIKGEMSIVGPRPHALDHNYQFSKELSGFMLRHKCKPGLTGLAQVNGYRGNIDNKEKLLKRYEYDMLYIKKWSPLLDIVIIVKTAMKFLFQKAH